MDHGIGDVVWLRRDSGLVELRSRVGTNPGRVGDAWIDDEGERISVVYEDEQVLALDVAAVEFATDRARPSRSDVPSAISRPALGLAVRGRAAPPAQAWPR